MCPVCLSPMLYIDTDCQRAPKVSCSVLSDIYRSTASASSAAVSIPTAVWVSIIDSVTRRDERPAERNHPVGRYVNPLRGSSTAFQSFRQR